MRPDAAPHMDMGGRIGRLALFGEALESPLRVAVAKQWPGVAPRGSLGEHFDRRVEPDGDRALIQQLAGPRIDEHSAAGGDDPDLAVDQPGDEPSLAIAKVRLAIAF